MKLVLVDKGLMDGTFNLDAIQRKQKIMRRIEFINWPWFDVCFPHAYVPVMVMKAFILLISDRLSGFMSFVASNKRDETRQIWWGGLAGFIYLCACHPLAVFSCRRMIAFGAFGTQSGDIAVKHNLIRGKFIIAVNVRHDGKAWMSMVICPFLACALNLQSDVLTHSTWFP